MNYQGVDYPVIGLFKPARIYAPKAFSVHKGTRIVLGEITDPRGWRFSHYPRPIYWIPIGCAYCPAAARKTPNMEKFPEWARDWISNQLPEE